MELKEKKRRKRKKKKGEERNNTRFTRDDTRHAIAWITHSAELIRLMTSWIRADRHENVSSLQFRKFLILHVLYIYIYELTTSIVIHFYREQIIDRKTFSCEPSMLRGSIPEWFIPVMRSTRLRNMATDATSTNPVADQREFGRDKWFLRVHACHTSRSSSNNRRINETMP